MKCNKFNLHFFTFHRARLMLAYKIIYLLERLSIVYAGKRRLWPLLSPFLPEINIFHTNSAILKET